MLRNRRIRNNAAWPVGEVGTLVQDQDPAMSGEPIISV
jgi:hypothetical protein